MVKKQALGFLIRWLVSSVAMFIFINVFGSFAEGSEGLRMNFWLYLTAGFIYSIANVIVRPFLTILSLPLIFLTMGLFTIIINAAMVGLTFFILPEIKISFLGAIGSCLVISLINYLVNLVMPDVK